MEPHEHVAKALDAIMGKGLPPAPRIDDTVAWECDFGSLQIDYQVEDYGSDYESASCNIVQIRTDFGGRHEAILPPNTFGSAHQQAFEDRVIEHCEEQERKRRQNAKDFPRGER
jgi:hypothetical protein